MSEKTTGEKNTVSVALRQLIKSITLFDLVLLIVPIIILILMLYPPMREVSTPFLFAGIIAYMLSPLVNILSRKFKLPKTISLLVVYFIFISIIILLFTRLISIANHELHQLSDDVISVPNIINNNIKLLPDWSQSFFEYLTANLRAPTSINQFTTLPMVRGTIQRIVYLFVFFIASFYLMKDKDKLPHLVRSSYLYERINAVLKSYLRGQLILIAFMTGVTWLFLSVVGVKFAFLLSVFTGFAEIIPFIGPISSTILSVAVVLVTGTVAFHTDVFTTALIVAVGYLILRYFEDLLVSPQVMGRAVELHPLVILFSTLLFGKLFGFIGLLLGVPFIATYKVIFEYTLKKND